MSVSAVSLNEIQAARKTFQVAPKAPLKVKDLESSTPKRFVDRFSDKQITTFFAPYGYIQHERSEDGGTILVLCDGCQIIFDDFSVMAEPVISLFTNNPDFDFGEFTALCEQANTTPSQAIADRLENDVFNAMPYYVERKQEFNKNNLGRIAKDKKYGSILSATVAKQTHRESYAPLHKNFGSTNPEQIADTLARVIPGR